MTVSSPWGTSPNASFGNDFNFKPLIGTCLMLIIGGRHEEIPTNYENKDRIHASIVALDGPEAGCVFENVEIRNEKPKRRYRGSAGKVHVGRVTSSIVANNEAIDIAEMSPYDDQLATGWNNYYPGRLAQLIQSTVAAFEQDEVKFRAEIAGQNQQGQQQPQAQPQPSSPWTQQAPPQPPPPPAPPVPNGGQPQSPWSGQPQPPTAPPAPAWPQFPPPAPSAPAPVGQGQPPWAGQQQNQDTPPY